MQNAKASTLHGKANAVAGARHFFLQFSADAYSQGLPMRILCLLDTTRPSQGIPKPLKKTNKSEKRGKKIIPTNF